MTKDELKNTITKYNFIFDKLIIVEIPIEHIGNASEPDSNLPGVYVHYSPSKGIVKIGKSQKNSRIRSRQHLNATTTKDKTYRMSELKDEPGAKVFLLNVKSSEDIHWLLGLEYYMEKTLKPFISSDRSG